MWLSKLKRTDSSIVLESDALRVVVVPQMGCKIRSLVSKRTGVEYFFQDARENLNHESYSSHDISGLDECFPSIMPCEYFEEPWRGLALGDHGWLWDKPWTAQLEGGQLLCEITIDAIPIVFRRTARLSKANSIVLQYTIENQAPVPFEFLYAAHVMLQADSTTRIIYPAEMSQAFVSVVMDNPVLQEQSWMPWPPDSGSFVREPLLANRSTLAKVFSAKLNRGLVGISHREALERLTIEFDTRQLPYLGVLLAPGFGPLGKDCRSTLLALEPTTSIADDLPMARATGTSRAIPAGQSINFWLRFSLEEEAAQAR